MKPSSLHKLLSEVQSGTLTIDHAMQKLDRLPFEDLGFARVDHQRELRQGAPEVIFGAGKSPEQVAAIAHALLERGANVLCTRASEAMFEAVRDMNPQAEFNALSRTIRVMQTPQLCKHSLGVLCAGTSDLPVAEEASVSAEFFGLQVHRINDVGVAGIHRLLSELEALQKLDVMIVVAGMEGALASVVGGLVSTPVICVPTSVGYGANFGGLAALLSMLNSCAAGLTVVNIDNGFGAAAAAFRILNRS